MIVAVRKLIFKNRQTIRSVLALLSNNIMSSILAGIGGLLVAFFLGPDETGPFRAYSIPLTYLMFLHLGTFDGLWRQIPYYRGKGLPENINRLASTAGAFNIILSVVISGGFVCCALYSLVHGDYYGSFGWLAQAIFCWEVFYGGYLVSTYRTLNEFVALAKISIFKSILTFCMVFILPFLRFYGLCARVAIPAIVGLWHFHKNRPLNVEYRLNGQAFKELVRVGLPFSIWGSLSTTVWWATESALILSLSGATALGLFSVAYTLRAAVTALPMAVWQVLTPQIVTSFARDESIRNANTRIIWVTVGLTGFMIILAWVGGVLLDIFVPVFIPKYVAGITAMKICLWFPVVQAAFLPVNAMFAAGKSWMYGRSVIPAIIVFFLSTYFLLPMYGGLLAVTIGSLLGSITRTMAGYMDLIILTLREN